MKNLVKHKAFVIGSLLGLLIFGLLNRLTADFSQVTQECMYRHLYGFPFLQFEKCEGDISYTHRYWFGMLGNVLCGLSFSLIVGFILEFIWAKFSSQKLK